MSLAESQSDAVILQMLVPTLEAEGFRVFLNPSRSILPSFMQGYQPDAIAMKADRKVAIEVKSRSGHAEPQVQRLRAMFSAHPDWELRNVYAPTQGTDHAITVIPHQLVVENLDRLLKVFDEAGSIPALLTGWSVFEAAARSLIPDHLGRPQTPGRLLEVLASEGYVTPAEADALRELGNLRNKAAHGKLDAAVTRDQIAELVSVTRSLLDQSTPEV
jgi:hypothetical protein